MKVSDYDYQLPDSRIATHPPETRGSTRLEVLHRDTGELEYKKYHNIVDYINPGDVIVLNDTKVIKARLIALNAENQQRELLLLEDHHDSDTKTRKVMYRGKLRQGEALAIGDTKITIEEIYDNGIALVHSAQDLLEISEHFGSVPLPPYMHRDATESDTERYQTVFAKDPGSVAAPTASLNFTQDIIDKLTTKGAKVEYLTLHVGLGTFLPIRSDNVENHTMHSEYFVVPAKTINSIKQAKSMNNKIIAVGTTVTRTLEYVSVASPDFLNSDKDSDTTLSGEANIFIYPGYQFKVVDAMLTNFHAPKSTVLMMAAAFASWPKLEKAYQEAINKKYSFLSYGDSILII